jgi:predicted deacylase
LGSRVKKGQRLATISDPLGDEEESAAAPFDGIVIGRSNLPLAHEGDALFNLAAFESVSKVEDVVEEFTATHDSEPRII